jgi:hypothetical protein
VGGRNNQAAVFRQGQIAPSAIPQQITGFSRANMVTRAIHPLPGAAAPVIKTISY